MMSASHPEGRGNFINPFMKGCIIMFKGKVFVVALVGLSLSLAGLIGCSSKKKTTVEPVKQEVKAPEKKPEAPAVVPKAPEKVEERVPSDLAFDTVYFDFDKSDIRADQRSTMEKNSQLLSKWTTVRIRVEGNCDERGTEEYNMALGQRRADSVVKYLTDYGVSSSRITTISYGEMRPAAQGGNETAWSQNRRCEFVITEK
jgi:peptidoglycan-associated lipoprotein